MEDKNLNAGDQNVENNTSDIKNTEKGATEGAPVETTQEAEKEQPQAEIAEVVDKEEAIEESPKPTDVDTEEVVNKVELEEEKPEAIDTESAKADQKEVSESENTQDVVASEEAEEEAEEDQEEHNENEELPDFTTYTRDQLVETIEALSHETTFKRSDRILAIINPMFFGMEDERRAMALNKYKEEGGVLSNKEKS